MSWEEERAEITAKIPPGALAYCALSWGGASVVEVEVVDHGVNGYSHVRDARGGFLTHTSSLRPRVETKDLYLEWHHFVLPLDVSDRVPAAYARVCAVFRANEDLSPTPHRTDRTPESHVYAALSHAVAHLRGKRDEDHLAHAAARLLMAMAEIK